MIQCGFLNNIKVFWTVEISVLYAICQVFPLLESYLHSPFPPYIFCSLRDIYPFCYLATSLHRTVTQYSVKAQNTLGEMPLSPLVFPSVSDNHFLVFHEDTVCHRDLSSSAISLAFGNPTVLYCREALNASKKSYTGLKLCHSHRCTTLGHAMKLGEKLSGQVTSDWFCHLNSLGFQPITQINTRLLIFSWFPINVRFIFVILYCSG